MQRSVSFYDFTTPILGAVLMLAGCGTQPGPVNSNRANANANLSNANVNSSNTNAANANSSSLSQVPEAAEPTEYQATVTMKLEAIGQQQKTALPTLTAEVARSGADRRMVFTMPAGGRVVYLDKAGTNYMVLPDKRQYAELNRESLGFEVRQLMMPEQIVEQVKGVQGVERVGEEKYNGRDAIRYRYGAVRDTQSQAGQIATESFLIVDKETGLPLHSETVSQSKSGGNIQGYSGLRIVTDISNVRTEAPQELFDEPTEFQKIDSNQVRAQVDIIFNSVAALLTQALNQAQSTMASPSPAR